MIFQFHTLTKPFLQENIDEFVAMLHRNLANEYWDSSHFLFELPGKWHYSFYVTGQHDRIIGFIIASEKEESVHIHKFVVDAPFQSKGLGGQMIDRIVEFSSKSVTLKVQLSNPDGLRFYKRKGFSITGQSGDLYTMCHID